MAEITTISTPSLYQLRAELEAMVLGDLLGPAGGEGEELTERTVRDRYLVGVLAPSRFASAAAVGRCLALAQYGQCDVLPCGIEDAQRCQRCVLDVREVRVAHAGGAVDDDSDVQRNLRIRAAQAAARG